MEMGVKFRSDLAGVITAIRFYIGSLNTGTHVAHLCDSSGGLLATATFVSETATGWQQVNFSTPVQIAPNTTYVASYFAPHGGYSYSSAYFATSGVVNEPLDALSDPAAGGNGVYVYSSNGGFPSKSFNATN